MWMDKKLVRPDEKWADELDKKHKRERKYAWGKWLTPSTKKQEQAEKRTMCVTKTKKT